MSWPVAPNSLHQSASIPFECFKGPVLIAQGALDPLNDVVTERASSALSVRA